MNISLQNVDKVSALLTVNIEKADYQEKVEKVLKTMLIIKLMVLVMVLKF